MENTEEICAICREDKCDFTTRCGHLFHEECLEAAVFSKDYMNCPYCYTEISSLKHLEQLICTKGVISNISFTSADITGLKELIKFGLERESFALVSVVQKMVELGWDMNELDYWLSEEKRSEPHSLFYASYVSGKVDLTHKLMELGCKVDRGIKKRIEKNESVLPHAVKINDMEFIKTLLKLGADINGLDFSKSALQVACETDNVEMIEFLLENAAEICSQETYNEIDLMVDYNIPIRVYETLLISACLNGSLNAIKYLHDNCPNCFTGDSVYWDAFATAIKKGNIPVIDLLIELGGDIDLVDSKCGRNLLMIACLFGSFEVIKHVFDKGSFDLNALDSDGYCALYFSLYTDDYPEIVKFLVEKGADPLFKAPYDDCTVLHIACGRNNFELIEYLLTRSPYACIDLKTIQPTRKGLVESVMDDSDENYPKIIDFLLLKGADINEKNMNGETVLFNAYKYNYEQVEFLLSRGADVNFVDSNGINCLQRLTKMIAPLHINMSILMLLIDNGLDVNWQDNQGWTLMHYSCKYACDIEIMELLKYGAKYDIPNYTGHLPFDILVSRYPFGVEDMEMYGVNYSKYIPEDVRSQSCNHCKRQNASLKARCGHYLHIHCIKDRRKCPICDTKVTFSNRLEQMIKESDFMELKSINDIELLALLENYIEDESIIGLELITNELQNRKKFKNSSKNKSCDLIELYAKASAYNRFELVKFFDSIFNSNKLCCDIKSFIICYAVMSGNIEMVDFLLEIFGSEFVNIRYNGEFAPIQIACYFKNLKIFDLLIEKGANIHFDNRRFENLLNVACEYGSYEIIKRLVEQHGFDPNAHSSVSDMPLYRTVCFTIPFSNSPLSDRVSDLIERYEKTEDDCIAIVQYLLDHGAKFDDIDSEDDSIVSLTGLNGLERVFDLFVEYSESVMKMPLNLENHKYIVVNIAKCGGNIDFLEKVINMGADVNWTDLDGLTALMAACQSRDYEMCSKLIESGANINEKDDSQWTALHYLCRAEDDNIQILNLLLDNGADIHSTTEDGENALHLAAQSVSLNSVKKLLAIGMDPNSVNFNLETPMHCVLTYCSYDENEKDILDVVKVLMDAGADINAEDADEQWRKTCYQNLSVAIELELNKQHFAEIALLEVFNRVLPSAFDSLKTEASRAFPAWDTATISNRFLSLALSLSAEIPDEKEVLFLASTPSHRPNASQVNDPFESFISSARGVECDNCGHYDHVTTSCYNPLRTCDSKFEYYFANRIVPPDNKQGSFRAWIRNGRRPLRTHNANVNRSNASRSPNLPTTAASSSVSTTLSSSVNLSPNTPISNLTMADLTNIML